MIRLITVLILLLPIRLYGQNHEYIEFPDSNTIWHFEYNWISFLGNSTYYYYSIMICGDTLINERAYKTLVSDSCNADGFTGAFREDKMKRLVYYVPRNDSIEQLLYDFNMQVGDTVKGYLETEIINPDIVQAIDSIQIGSRYHKRWLINPSYSIYLIEGVGSTYGLVEYSIQHTDGPDFSLFCFQQNDQTLYPDTLSDCEYPEIIITENILNSQIQVFPNPCRGTFSIDNKNHSITEVYVQNMLGQVIYTKMTDFEDIIQVNGLKQDIYLLTLRNRNMQFSNHIIISSP